MTVSLAVYIYILCFHLVKAPELKHIMSNAQALIFKFYFLSFQSWNCMICHILNALIACVFENSFLQWHIITKASGNKDINSA